MTIQNVDFKEINADLEPSAAKLAAAAYYDNPAHVYLCPDDKTRLQQLEWLLGINLRLQLKYGAESFCYPENGVVKAMGFWTKPNEVHVGTFAKIKAGLLKVPFKMGWGGFKRVLVASAGTDDHLQKALGNKLIYWYLNYMVMEESRRGKGWGAKILEKQFELIHAKESNAVLALSTHRYWTVKFYERLGFEVLLEDKIGTGSLAFTNWVMRKKL